MQSPPTEYQIQPNSACNDGSWRWWLASLVVLSALISMRFAWLGLWMIAPFALAEIAALGLGLWFSLHRSLYREKVIIDHDMVEIRHLQKGRNRSWRFPLYGTQVTLHRSAHRWYPHRLLLGGQGRWVEIGRCLTQGQRSTLATAINGTLTQHRTHHD